jgi:ubiquinone biosynthesis protein UbiJ
MNAKNPLTELLTGSAETLLNRGVARSTTAAALCKRLEGRTFAVETGSAELDTYFTVEDGQLKLEAGTLDEPDAAISGSPLNLAWLAAADSEEVIRSGNIHIRGNAGVAADFRQLLELVRPDWEEELSVYTGDAVAHEVGRVVRDLADWAANAGQSLGRSIAEYLTEESRDLVARAEVDEFNRGVDDVANAVERCEARLKLLRDRLSEA